MNLKQVDSLREIIMETEVFSITKVGTEYRLHAREETGIKTLSIDREGIIRRIKTLRFTNNL